MRSVPLEAPLTGSCTGINIPNYHDVRENDGFKNVSLSNILSAKAKGEVATFIAPEEREMHDKWADKAFEVGSLSSSRRVVRSLTR